MNGTWQKVRIVEKESEYLYKVHYIGQSDSADEWLSLSQIKNIDSSVQPVNVDKEEVKMTSPVNCRFSAPVGAINNSENFSEKVAKRKIYECLVFLQKKPAVKTGVSYLYLQMQQPFTNAVSITAAKDLLLKTPSAPAGAMVYPIRTKYRICQQNDGNISTQIVDGNFNCYRNSKGFWECSAENE